MIDFSLMQLKVMFFLSLVSGILSLWAEKPKPNAAPMRLPVFTVTTVEDFQVKVLPGRVTPIARVDVIPQVSGEILEVAFENGAVVREGDLLYRIDPVKYEAAVKNAEAKVEECRANLAYATLSYQRHQKLIVTHAVSLDAVDSALSARDTARSALAAAAADLVKARDDLKHCRITAPIAGKLGTTAKTKGNYVSAGDEILVSLVQSHPIRVRFSLSNREFLDLFGASNKRIRAEAKLSLSLANGEPYAEQGSVEYVDNEADEQTDTVMVYAIFSNEDRRLKAGGTVRVTLSSVHGVKRPAIPPTAILQDTQGPYVWALSKDNCAERRTIARGNLAGSFLFVEKGLQVGERIVADGAHRVSRGMKIEPVSETPVK